MKKKLLLLIPCVIGLNVHAASVNVTSSANYIEAGNRVTFYINMQGLTLICLMLSSKFYLFFRIFDL